MSSRSGYGQFCPVALAAEVLAEKWTPLVIRELLCGSVRFNDLQRGLPRMSPALLGARLRKLEQAGIVSRTHLSARQYEYRLTPAGAELFPVIEKMGLWSQKWLRHELVSTANLDPDLLMWDIRRNVRQLEPGRRCHVVEFRLSGAPIKKRRYWLVFEPGHVDLCYRDPGHEVALFVTATVRDLTEVWLGHRSVASAARDGRLALEGSRRDVAEFQSWFSLSMFAPAALAEATAEASA